MLHLRKTIAKSILLCSAFMLLVSCQFNGIKGSGNVITEHRPVSEDFKSIKVEKGLDVVLEQSNTKSITVIADDNVQKHIKTSIENGVLTITSDVTSYLNVTSKKIVVSTPIIENIKVSSGASLNSKNTIKSNKIAIKASSGATIIIVVETENALCEVSSGSDMKISGKAITFETAASSGSSLDAEKLVSNQIIASASSGSNIDVYPLVSLKAVASSGGLISYHNVPKNLNKKSSSGGSIAKN